MMFLGVSTVSRRSWHVRTRPMVLAVKGAACKSLCGATLIDSLASFGAEFEAMSISSALEVVVRSELLELAVSVLFVDTEDNAKELLSNKANEGGLLCPIGLSGKEMLTFTPFGGTEGKITALLLVRLHGKASRVFACAVSSLQPSISLMTCVVIEVE